VSRPGELETPDTVTSTQKADCLGCLEMARICFGCLDTVTTQGTLNNRPAADLRPDWWNQMPDEDL
jgi:hypothetical protein